MLSSRVDYCSHKDLIYSYLLGNKLAVEIVDQNTKYLPEIIKSKQWFRLYSNFIWWINEV